MPHGTGSSDNTDHLPTGGMAGRGRRTWTPQGAESWSCPRFRGLWAPRRTGLSHCVGMSPIPQPLPPSLDGQFSVRTAIAEGATARRMRAHDLASPFRGVRRTAEFAEQRETQAEEDDEPYAEYRRRRLRLIDDARAYREVMPEGSFFCGATAAVIGYGAPVRHPSRLDVAVIDPQRAPRAKGIRGRKVAPHLATVAERDGLRMTTAASTWAMLGRELNLRELVEVGDALVQIPRDDYGHQHPELVHATIADLAAEVTAGPRPPSTRKLREALELVRVGSSSVLETDFRLDAAAAGLPDAALDIEIRDDRGVLLGISEIVYPRFRVVVEVEGDHHRTSRAQWNRDLEKYDAYVSAGWEPVRLSSLHIRRNRDAVRRVAAALRRHGWDG